MIFKLPTGDSEKCIDQMEGGELLILVVVDLHGGHALHQLSVAAEFPLLVYLDYRAQEEFKDGHLLFGGHV
jgi:hypothetical protein